MRIGSGPVQIPSFTQRHSFLFCSSLPRKDAYKTSAGLSHTPTSVTSPYSALFSGGNPGSLMPIFGFVPVTLTSFCILCWQGAQWYQLQSVPTTASDLMLISPTY